MQKIECKEVQFSEKKRNILHVTFYIIQYF